MSEGFLKKPTITVVTSSIGRPELRACIESVQKQDYPLKVKHMVFVNGPPWHEKAKETLKDFPEVEAFYLREETGDVGIGPGCGNVFAAGPWLTNSDLIFYLNDDDFYEPDHVSSMVKIMWENNLSWAYSLRRFVDKDGKPFCEDDFDSLGFWSCVYSDSQFLVDNSCYAMRKDVAKRFGHCWSVPAVGDRAVLRALKQAGLRAGCTGMSTVNYRVGGSAPPPDSDYYKINTEAIKARYPEEFPWRKKTVFISEGS